MSVFQRAQLSCDGKAQYSALCRKAVRSTHHWNAAITHPVTPNPLINKISLFIGIIVILLYLQAAPNLSSHGIAFFFKHTKTYVHLSPLSVNSKYTFSFEIPLMIETCKSYAHYLSIKKRNHDKKVI